ncbi:non-specific lipid transfer protein GPI-anchored 13-like isoform X2 [Musa acuminata AAA Group]|uniref:non-specific lipid transfer protein GPI-anchored 13-like isoform X2 n=1 Tax=Musa acuminata AAA Group TaxID=214697 RepID=UPI0031DD222D
MAANSPSSSSFSSLLLLVLLALSFVIRPASSDTASDLQECGSQLIGLQTCIPYVEGTAQAPTPDCCTGLKDVVAKSPKCLCILVKDHDDPQLPIKINVTRALALPNACNTPVNISACPKLLNLPPNSKEAEIFKQAGSAAQANATATTSPPSTPASDGGGSSNHSRWRGWVAMETVVGCVLYTVMHLLLVST